VLREAQNRGLLTPDVTNPRFLHLQSVLPFFLKNRLRTPELQERRAAIGQAFRQHYEIIAITFYNLLTSKQPEERPLGQFLVYQEYENLLATLHLVLASQKQAQIIRLYNVLAEYLEQMQEPQRGLELTQLVLAGLQGYPVETQEGEIGREIIVVLDSLARSHLSLKQYNQAEQACKQALERMKQNTFLEEQNIRQYSASIYHQLGMIAQEQRKWREAERYYQQALQIYIEYQDSYAQASTYHQLGIVAQKSGKKRRNITSKPYRSILSIRIAMPRPAPTTS